MENVTNGTQTDFVTKIAEQSTSFNPLSNYYRQPKIYIRLPSRGQYYPVGSLDTSETGEYPVFAMTAKDELMFKTPDALMNGQSTVEVIKSCIPSIKNPWVMPSIDLDAALIGIRIATYGDTMSVTSVCPKCAEENRYDFTLVTYLDQLNLFEYQSEINVDPLTIHIKPYTYKEVTKTAIKALEQERIFNIIHSETMTDEEKVDHFGVSFLKLTELTIGLVTNSICQIDTPEGSVTDTKFIQEFIANAPKEVFGKIKDHIDKMKERIELKSPQLVCAECLHEYSASVSLDQSNFFEVRS